MESDIRFLSNEMGIDLADVGMAFYFNETKEIQQAVVKILDEERDFKKNNDVKYNPERQKQAESILVDIIAQMQL